MDVFSQTVEVGRWVFLTSLNINMIFFNQIYTTLTILSLLMCHVLIGHKHDEYRL